MVASQFKGCIAEVAIQKSKSKLFPVFVDVESVVLAMFALMYYAFHACKAPCAHALAGYLFA